MSEYSRLDSASCGFHFQLNLSFIEMKIFLSDLHRSGKDFLVLLRGMVSSY